MNKRGLPNIVTITLLVLLAIAIIVIIWAFISRIAGKAGDVDETLLTVNMEIPPQSVAFNTTEKSLILNIKRNPGKGNVTGYHIVIYDTEGNAFAKNFTNQSMEEFQVNYIFIDYSSSTFGMLKKIELYAIQRTIRTGEEFLGRKMDEYIIRGNEETLSCTTDDDDDGYNACEDCDDNRLACGASCNPGISLETNCTDNYDNDCDSLIDSADSDCIICADNDGDTYNGYNPTGCPAGADCNDNNNQIYPANSNNYCDCDDSDGFDQGTTEMCDGIDNNCNGYIDFNAYEETYSTGTEICNNGFDDDCDNSIDCGDTDCVGDPACTTCPDTTCAEGEACSADCSAETWCADGVDNDEDGATDGEDSDCVLTGMDGVGQLVDAIHLDNARAIYVKGNYAYVAYQQGVSVVDITNPTAPFLTGWDDTLSMINSIKVSDDGAYLYAAGSTGFHVLSLNDPTNPSHIITKPTTYSATAIAISDDGQYAYVTAKHTGLDDKLYVYDISSPESPSEIAAYVDSAEQWWMSNPDDVAYSGGYLYIVSGDGGPASADRNKITKINVIAPTSAFLVWKRVWTESTCNNIDEDMGCYVNNPHTGSWLPMSVFVTNRVYVAGRTSPGSLLSIIKSGGGTYWDTTDSKMNNARSVFVQGDYAFVPNSGYYGTIGYLNALDITVNPPAIVVYVSNSDSQISEMSGWKHVFVKGNYAYVVSEGADSLAIIELLFTPI